MDLTKEIYNQPINIDLKPLVLISINKNLEIVSINGETPIPSLDNKYIYIENNKLMLSKNSSSDIIKLYNNVLKAINSAFKSPKNAFISNLKYKYNHFAYVDIDVHKREDLVDLAIYFINEDYTKISLDYLKQREDDYKVNFFTDSANELRRPLNIILGITQLWELKSSQETHISKDKINSYVNVAHINSLRLLRNVNNILDLIKLDSSSEFLDKKIINIVELVEEIVTASSSYAKDKNIQLTFDTNSEEVFTNVDPYKIEKVIFNLISNAIKFAPENGYIDVDINSSFNKVFISIKDSGPGVDSSKIPNLFKYYNPVNPTFIRDKYGSGIGLLLSYNIVKSHNGILELSNTSDHGSKFTVTLPLADIGDDEFIPYTHIITSADLELSDTYTYNI